MTELTAAWGMDEGITGKQEAVAGAMESLEQCIQKKTRSHMKMMEDMARRMDSEFDGIEGIDWCRLIYIPHSKILKKNVSAKVKEWVRLSEFEIALD